MPRRESPPAWGRQGATSKAGGHNDSAIVTAGTVSARHLRRPSITSVIGGASW